MVLLFTKLVENRAVASGGVIVRIFLIFDNNSINPFTAASSYCLKIFNFPNYI